MKKKRVSEDNPMRLGENLNGLLGIAKGDLVNICQGDKSRKFSNPVRALAIASMDHLCGLDEPEDYVS